MMKHLIRGFLSSLFIYYICIFINLIVVRYSLKLLLGICVRARACVRVRVRCACACAYVFFPGVSESMTELMPPSRV